MQLYQLMFGNSKKKLRPIMIDSESKCVQYMKARKNSGKNKAANGHYALELAPKDAKVWRKSSCTIGGNKPNAVERVGHGANGYVGKHGFNPHT